MKHEHRIEMISAGNRDLSEAERAEMERHLQIAIIETLYQKHLLTYVQREQCLEKLEGNKGGGLHP